MLPPLRPFRNKPAPKVIIKKKTAGVDDAGQKPSIQGTRKELKQDLQILHRASASADNAKAS